MRIEQNTGSGYAKQLNKMSAQNTSELSVSVECDQTNFLNLQYLFLWLQKHDKKCRLDITSPERGILSNEIMANWARISAFLSCNDVKRRITNTSNLFGRGFPVKSLRNIDNISLQKVLPLLSVDYYSYRFLSGLVRDCFSSAMEEKDHFVAVEHEYTDEDGKVHSYLKFNDLPSGHGYGESAETIYRACSNYLFRQGGLNKIPFDERIEYFQSHGFFQKVESLSVLAFLIFCAYDKTLAIGNTGRKKPKQREEEIDEIILNVLDISDGLLQLIENVVFHAKDEKEEHGCGLLSFRIHENRADATNDSTYLNLQYGKYFEGSDNRYEFINNREAISNDLMEKYKIEPPKSAADKREYDEAWSSRNNRREARADVDYFLEIRLFDYSGKDMCETFLAAPANGPYADAFSGDLSLQMFFGPAKEQQEKTWGEFFSNPYNAVHHYGLQLFDALLKGNDGCLIAQSCSGLTLDNEKKYLFTTSGDRFAREGESIFPGTQYAILLPFIKKHEYSPSFINTNINYSLSELKAEYTVRSRREKPDPAFLLYMDKLSTGEVFFDQKEKTACITQLYNILDEFKPSPTEVVLFDASELNLYNMEVFAKSLMMYIGCNRELVLNFAVCNCDAIHFIKLVRLFAVFYDRNGNNNFMSNVQIYLAGKESKDEFLISGTNLKSALVAQIKLSAARGISGGAPSKITRQLVQMLARFPGEGHDRGTLAFVPFDMLIRNEQGFSIFEQNALNVLKSDIQSRDSGCKIYPNHMRIGSKIHLDTFYEAETLFYNNYYTTRYAFLLGQMIRRKIKRSVIDKNMPLLLIGYETYSEMLLRELCKFFKDDAAYCIFEYGTTNKYGEKNEDMFRHLEGLDMQKTYQPIYIVPINSTLSTFNKLEAEFIKRYVDSDSKAPVRLSDKPVYLGVVQVRGGKEDSNARTKEEKLFFKRVDVKNRFIVSKLLNRGPVHYINLISCGWENPLGCKQCYPSNYFSENPLIETDKSSVIPSQLFGKHNKTRKSPKSIEDGDYIKKLKDHFLFGHVSRGVNHFSFYIKTEEFFSRNSALIEQWLEDKVKPDIYPRSEKIIRYDIIICPVHFSNPSFVKSVNDRVFGGASLVIGVDANKEFRDNFIAKHSDLRSLYKSLSKMGSSAEINFHFVDDSIIHGSTFLRVRSLVYSLFFDYDFTRPAENPVKVNIFYSVIILLNRLSNDSKKNFILDTNRFFNYLTLNISSLRTHDNACIMCKEAADLDLLSKTCSHEWLSNRFHNMHKLVCVEDFSKFKPLLPQDRGFLRLYCSHELNSEFKRLTDTNNKSQVFEALVKKIYEETNAEKAKPQKLDLLISYLTVAATPFLSFRKSTHEAVFDLIIILLETVLFDFDDDGKSDAKKRDDILDRLKSKAADGVRHKVCTEKAGLLDIPLLKLLIKSVLELIRADKRKFDRYRYERDLLKALIKLSSGLKSSYLLRGENIVRILSRADRYQPGTDGYTFTEYYMYNIKKLLTLGTDEAKSAFLEYLLLNGNEYSPSNPPTIDLPESIGANFFEKNPFAQKFRAIKKEISGFADMLYLENTKILYDAALDFYRKDRQADEYFLENFKSILKWNHIYCEELEIINILRKIQTTLAKDTSGIKEYYSELAMQEEDTDIKEYYFRLAKQEDDTSDIKKYYSELAWQVSELLAVFANDEKQSEKPIRPDVYFLARTNEYVLELKEIVDGAYEDKQLSLIEPDISSEPQKMLVKSRKVKTVQCFAWYEEEKNAGAPVFDALVEAHLKEPNKYILSDIKLGKCCQIIGFDKNANGKTKKPSIYMVIRYPSGLSDFQILRAFRVLLVFRDSIGRKIKADFNSNLLQQELQTVETQKQLRKARSGYHADSSDEYNPEQLAGGCFLGISTPDNYSYNFAEAVYTFLINTVIGRVNTKVIHPHEDIDGWMDSEYTLMERNLASIANISRNKGLVLVNQIGREIEKGELEEYFRELFQGRIYRKNEEGKLPYHIYVTAFVAELVSSAVRHGDNSGGVVKVGLELDDDGCLWVCNKVKAGFNRENVEEGLARKGMGISLPAICSYFELFYKKADGKTNDGGLVRIRLPSENDPVIKIGLPLFERKESQTL